MATLNVVDTQNQKSGQVELLPAVFEGPVRGHLIAAEVRRQLAGRRAGTHSTLNRSGVSGGGAKPWRQKGTGRARQGTTRAPQWAGGGVVFGPVPRKHEHALPKKMRRAALQSALSDRCAAGAITVVEGLSVDEYKTKRVLEILAALGLSEKSVLIVISESSPQLEASARNLPGVGLVRAEGVNVYDILRHQHLVLTREAVDQVAARVAGASAEDAQ